MLWRVINGTVVFCLQQQISLIFLENMAHLDALYVFYLVIVFLLLRDAFPSNMRYSNNNSNSYYHATSFLFDQGNSLSESSHRVKRS